jgi:predicted 3-demethylubiquinone-9 3-methyltransferase (glyoxalase superfamily)
MAKIRGIVPCLWFDGNAEEAAKFYVSVFGGSSRIVQVSHFGDAGQEIHGRAPGSVMTVAFELDGHPFTGLNGGPQFQFNEAISFQVMCKTQDEIDDYWSRLSAVPAAEQCGWLKDRFGLSWQIVPIVLPELLTDRDAAKANRVMTAMLRMKKLDIAELQRAYAG